MPDTSILQYEVSYFPYLMVAPHFPWKFAEIPHPYICKAVLPTTPLHVIFVTALHCFLSFLPFQA